MSALASELGITPGTYNIDPAHSEVTFVIRHLMSKVRGSFTEFSGSFEIAENALESSTSVEIQIKSIDTRNADRDNHIRSAEILDLDNHPAIRFVSTGVRENGDKYFLDGDLTIRDVTRPVTLDLEFNGTGQDPWGGTRAGFSASTSISRKEYGIEFNIPLGGDKALLGDNVDIQLEVQATHV
ncbi:YceI family protein [Actinoallomurus iriomotensis]|uniref:Polyisoprenoid-binding protein n=1 Tax=Actinoallomurus iriomotensis TaxID=478107 RepID=A0A9W6VT69_9ACTN|nr:YceI family protein [Actinoallomurus iriomotensis]GLY84158.1 polyisoprenoid-binding protein [Actinoallomurus iriomotensis]